MTEHFSPLETLELKALHSCATIWVKENIKKFPFVKGLGTTYIGQYEYHVQNAGTNASASYLHCTFLVWCIAVTSTTRHQSPAHSTATLQRLCGHQSASLSEPQTTTHSTVSL